MFVNVLVSNDLFENSDKIVDFLEAVVQRSWGQPNDIGITKITLELK